MEVPDSPLTVISPAEDGEQIVTSLYLLELQVVPGSTVMVNGEDVTDMVDRSGLLSQNVNVYPIGDNVYTIIVQTPQHHETRQEVHIYREAFDIELELSSSVAYTSSNDVMAITGTVEPGATINRRDALRRGQPEHRSHDRRLPVHRAVHLIRRQHRPLPRVDGGARRRRHQPDHRI